MNLPNQSQPVRRSENTRFASQGINPSGIACTLCCTAAGLVPFPGNIAAKLACKAIGGCSC